MSRTRVKRVFVLGAGFSWYAGLPLQSKFTEALLAASKFADTAPSKLAVEYLKTFVCDVFGTPLTASDRWPKLEDLFTNIDQAANAGHNLGKGYAPADLRTVRRALIFRTIRMLHQLYERAQHKKNPDWVMLEEFFREIDLRTCAFINMNWDTVVERGIQRIHPDYYFDYMCDATAARFPKGRRSGPIERDDADPDANIHIVKIHGSTNWLYCDNCRRLFWFPPGKTMSVSNQLLTEDDWERIHPGDRHRMYGWTCSRCKTVRLTTRLATFSYLKALDCPMFQKSWFSASELLDSANSWVFIGYSLPAADYEFKHLLKRAQLSRSKEPRLVVITKDPGANETIENYQRFFGEVKPFDQGIRLDVLSYLSRHI